MDIERLAVSRRRLRLDIANVGKLRLGPKPR